MVRCDGQFPDAFNDSRVALVRSEGFSCYPDLRAWQDMDSSTLRGGAFPQTKIHELLELLLRDAGLASGGQKFNPLGGIVNPGDTVVIKPNLVSHDNQSGQGLDCLVTHPTLIAAVLDYVLLASPRKVLVADAPIQTCNWDQLMEQGGYHILQEHYRRAGAPVSWLDLRRTTLDKTKAVWKRQTDVRSEDHYVLFDLGTRSLLEPISNKSERFRVAVYDPDLMRQTHAPGRHQYLVAREITEADVVINLPKLKTHKKAGLTGALKNVIGINGNKDYLPHHCLGGSKTGGDCYAGGSRLKLASERFTDAANRRSGTANLVVRQFARACRGLSRLLGEDANTDGSWHGNDTIWRTCLDLNRVLVYGRNDGTLADSPQRRVLSITDALVAGEGEGPLAPTPKTVGILTCAQNQAAAEYVHAHIMGLDWTRIPVLQHAFEPSEFPLTNFLPGDVKLISEGREISQPWAAWPHGAFRPPEGWHGHCEIGSVGKDSVAIRS